MAFATTFIRPTLTIACCRGYSARVVGPASEDILRASEQGRKYFNKNLDRLRFHGRITYSAHMPNEDIVLFKKLFQDLARQTETLHGEVRSLNAKVEKLLSASSKTP